MQHKHIYKLFIPYDYTAKRYGNNFWWFLTSANNIFSWAGKWLFLHISIQGGPKTVAARVFFPTVNTFFLGFIFGPPCTNGLWPFQRSVWTLWRTSCRRRLERNKTRLRKYPKEQSPSIVEHLLSIFSFLCCKLYCPPPPPPPSGLAHHAPRSYRREVELSTR